MPMFCPLQAFGLLTGSLGQREHCVLDCTSPVQRFCLTDLEEEERKQVLVQMPQTLIVLTEFQQILWSRCLFICCVPLGPFPLTLYGCFLKISSPSFTGEWVHGSSRTVKPELHSNSSFKKSILTQNAFSLCCVFILCKCDSIDLN